MIGSIRKGGQSEVLDKMRPVPYIRRYLDLADIRKNTVRSPAGSEIPPYGVVMVKILNLHQNFIFRLNLFFLINMDSILSPRTGWFCDPAGCEKQGRWTLPRETIGSGVRLDGLRPHGHPQWDGTIKFSNDLGPKGGKDQECRMPFRDGGAFPRGDWSRELNFIGRDTETILSTD